MDKGVLLENAIPLDPLRLAEQGLRHSLLKRDPGEVKVLKKSLMLENFGELLTV